MKISAEFSKHAKEYNRYNIVQEKVVQKLLALLTTQPKRILDLGCGNGALCKAIDWEYEHYTGIDFAPHMLELHPKSDTIECIYGDFNTKSLFEDLYHHSYEHIFSASALQWAEDIEEVCKNIAFLSTSISLAIFTSGTFRTLNTTAGIESILQSSQYIEGLNEKYFQGNFEVVTYTIEFESTREMFRYIKRSGISGSRNILGYKQTKKLMQEYPLSYLEFEVAFISR